MFASKAAEPASPEERETNRENKSVIVYVFIVNWFNVRIVSGSGIACLQYTSHKRKVSNRPPDLRDGTYILIHYLKKNSIS